VTVEKGTKDSVDLQWKTSYGVRRNRL